MDGIRTSADRRWMSTVTMNDGGLETARGPVCVRGSIRGRGRERGEFGSGERNGLPQTLDSLCGGGGGGFLRVVCIFIVGENANSLRREGAFFLPAMDPMNSDVRRPARFVFFPGVLFTEWNCACV